MPIVYLLNKYLLLDLFEFSIFPQITKKIIQPKFCSLCSGRAATLNLIKSKQSKAWKRIKVMEQIIKKKEESLLLYKFNYIIFMCSAVENVEPKKVEV